MTLVLCFVGVTVCYADDPMMGTWNLNEAKSKLSPGMSKNTVVVYAAMGENVKITIDGTDSSGKPAHSEWTGKLDGKDYPVTGSLNTDTRALTKVNDRTVTFTEKQNGKVTFTGRIVVAADGKSRTVTSSGTDAKGNKVKGTAVYDKQ
jgi:hypothetical protein